MKICLVYVLLCLSIQGYAHPSVGIVKDSKGNIYYSDLHQVWKIAKGKKTIVVPNVHTHELYIDQKDNIFGEGGYYDDKAVKFYHYTWVLRPTGQIDTVMGMKEAYVQQDFSLARDKKGNEFYIKRFLVSRSDTNHIYRRSPGGTETILATGNFKEVNWLHPQDDGSVLYASGDAVFRVDSVGNIKLLTDNIRNQNDSSSGDILIWGLWQDQFENVYAAVFSDKAILKIDKAGNISKIYTSKGNWSPLQGLFDKVNVLWVMEGSDKNEVRVVPVYKVQENAATQPNDNFKTLKYLALCFCILGIGLLMRYRNKTNPT